ncbi:MAG: hypothetical protein BGO41_02565 [Clostridiales bacterium 38-18]|nr:MAG: hypothetical protein BGO41_02565 [Clostridiales bacterium 38-18]
MKLKVFLLMLFSCLLISGFGFASDVLVTVNDQLLEDEGIIIKENGIPYGLLSEFAQRMDITLEWLPNAKFAVLNIGEDYVSYKMDSNLIVINNKSDELTNESFVRDGRIYVPLYSICDVMGIQMTWDSELVHVTLSSPTIKIAASEVRSMNYSEEDLIWLARIIEAETRGGSLDKKTAVANVVLNRVASPKFPNTIYEVIYQRNQFPPAYKSSFLTRELSQSSLMAAKRAMMGVEIAPNCLYFNSIPFASKADSFYKLIEGDYFYF